MIVNSELYNSSSFNVVLSDEKTYSDIENACILVCTPKQQQVWEDEEDLKRVTDMGARFIPVIELVRLAIESADVFKKSGFRI